MTPKLNINNNSKSYSLGDLPALKTGETNQLKGAMNMQKRDRFELLSAYLDGEVTAAERRQVEDWLTNDPATQRLYGRLLKLRQGLRVMPVPQEQSTEQTVQQVFARINRRPKMAVAWGGAAIAAVFIGALSSALPARQSLGPQVAQQYSAPDRTTEKHSEALMVALNSPIMEIPKAPVAAPETHLLDSPSSPSLQQHKKHMD
jgi:hypothetical protein